MTEDSGRRGRGRATPDGEPSSPSEPAPKVEVRRSSRRKRTVTAYRERDTIVVLLPGRMSAREEREWVDRMVHRVLGREARVGGPRGDAELAARAATLVAEHLVPVLGDVPTPASVTWVSNQRYRWGSCTPSTRTIRLSERLRPLPSWVIDYVLLHELVHLVEPTHSRRFWSLLSAYPRAERARGFLEGYTAAGEAVGDAPAAPGPRPEQPSAEEVID